MSNRSILIIDNNRNRSQSLKMLLEFMDFKVEIFSQLSAIDSSHQDYYLIIFGDKTSSDFLPSLRELTSTFSQISFILLENEQSLPLDLFKQQYPLCLGIFKEPFKQDTFANLVNDLSADISTSNNTLVHESKKKESKSHHKEGGSSEYIENHLIGQSKEIQLVKKLIKQVAHSNANVLILGESGTGKEVVARCVHQLSKRCDNAYVPVNCGAIPADLLESELFGHEKGAFTGAINTRQGRFELAQGGTLFLDEIGDMPLAMQVKILRILQEKIFERVGGNKSITADVRILAATHRNLDDRVSDGSFREDLFYRLNVFPIEIPPLKDRVADIPLLVNFINKSIEDEKDERVNFSDNAMASIFLHSWPGNIRELANLVERLAIMFGSEVIQYEDLPEKYKNDISGFDYKLLKQVSIQNNQPDSTASVENKPIKTEESTNSTIHSKRAENDDKKEVISIDNVIPEKTIPDKISNVQITNPLPDLDEDDSFNLKEHLGNLEQTLIEDALSKTNGVVAHAAKRLNIRRTTLVEKMRKYGI